MSKAQLINRSDLPKDPKYNTSDEELSPVKACALKDEEKDPVQKITKSYFTDVNDNPLEKITKEKEVMLVVESENMSGEEIVINLPAHYGDFKYDGKVITEDEVLKVSVGGDTEKIKLETIARRKDRKRVRYLKGGSKGGWNKTLNKPLEPSTVYVVDDYTYETDDKGRVNKVTGELYLNERGRNEYQQGKSVKLKDGTQGEDDGGHLIAQIFDGPGEQINYVPQNANLNRGRWKTMENEWAEALSDEPPPPQKVEVEILPIYDDDSDSKRPIEFEVFYKIDGIEQPLKTFDN